MHAAICVRGRVGVDAPVIATAIPKRRYQLGDFSAVVLGDVTSRDNRLYEYVMALIPDGEQSPILYITAERVTPPGGREQLTVVRVVAEEGERTLGPEERWRELDAFAEDALAMARQVMGLGHEEATRLL